GGAGAPRAVVSRRADRARRHLAARPALQGPDRRAPERLPGADVRPVRDRVRRAHDPRHRETARGGRRCGGRRAAGPGGGSAAAVGGAPVAHLRRQAGGMAARPLQHRGASLPQRIELTPACRPTAWSAPARSRTRARGFRPRSCGVLLHCNKIFGFHPITRRDMAAETTTDTRPGTMRLVDAIGGYRYPVMAIVSILHRLSGMLLFFLLPFIVWL